MDEPGRWADGFYLSEYQRAIGLPELQAAWEAGYRYVHLRTSSGWHRDPTFPRHWANAGTLGFRRSVWHYVTQNETGQAALFRAVVGPREPELGIYADLEAHDLTLDKCQQFLEAADRNFGQVCNVYTAAWWLNPRGTPPWQAEGRALWVCDVVSEEAPRLPRAFTEWAFWQHACRRLEPFPCVVCVDRYHGTEAELPGGVGGSDST